MAITVRDAVQLNETVQMPDGYNRVTITGFGDEYKRQIFPLLTISVPAQMVSDDETWYWVELEINDYNRADNVLVHNIVEDVKATNDFYLSAGSQIKTLNTVYTAPGGTPCGAGCVDNGRIYENGVKEQYLLEVDSENKIQLTSVVDGTDENEPNIGLWGIPEAFGIGPPATPSPYVDYQIDYEGNQGASFSTGYPSSLPPHLKPDDESNLVGGEFSPENATVIVDGYTVDSDPPIGRATVRIKFKPTASASGSCVITGQYMGYEVYGVSYVERGGFVGAARNLEADPSTVYPRGTVDNQEDKSDKSLLTFWGTNADGTPLEVGTEIIFEILSGKGSLTNGGVGLITIAEDTTEDVFSSSDVQLSVSHPIVSIQSIALDGVTNGNYDWKWDPTTTTIDGTTIHLDPTNAFPLMALPATVVYTAGGVAYCTYISSRTSQPEDEYLMSGKISGTKLNATALINIGDAGDDTSTSYTFGLSASPTQLTKFTTGVPEDPVGPPPIIYTSNLEVRCWNSSTGVVPSSSVDLELTYGGRSGRLQRTKIAVVETRTISSESASISSSADSGQTPVWDTITVAYPISGYQTHPDSRSGSGGTTVEVYVPGSGQTLHIDRGQTYGNVIKLASPEIGGLPVEVTYTATGFGTTDYIANVDGVEELVGIQATMRNLDPALYAFQEITVGTPNNDNLSISATLYPDTTIEYTQQVIPWRLITGQVIDEDTGIGASGVRVDYKWTSGTNGGFWYIDGSGNVISRGTETYSITDSEGRFDEIYLGCTFPFSKATTASVTAVGLKDSVPDQPISTTNVTMNIDFPAVGTGTTAEVTLFKYTIYVDVNSAAGGMLDGDASILDFGFITDTSQIIRSGQDIYCDVDPSGQPGALVSYTYTGPYETKIDPNNVFLVGNIGNSTLSVVDEFGAGGWQFKIEHKYEATPFRKVQPFQAVLEEVTSFAEDPQGTGYSGVPYANLYILGQTAAGSNTIIWKGTCDVRGQLEIPVIPDGSTETVGVPCSEVPGLAKEYDVFIEAENFRYNKDPIQLADYGISAPAIRGYDTDSKNDKISINYLPNYRYIMNKTLEYTVEVKAKIFLGEGESLPTDDTTIAPTP
jgi:hypothetical protein